MKPNESAKAFLASTTNEASEEASEDSSEAARHGIRVNLVSLGCPKNLVDSEMILGRLGQEGFVVTPESDDADVLVINTCGFVESAKRESIDTILEACQIKEESATPKRVVVTGCLGQRYGSELRTEIPELDAIVGLGEYGDLGSALRGLFRPDAAQESYFKVTDPTKACNREVGRFRLTPAHFGYLRISEGCDNPCTFCAIPAIRGRFRSKPIEDLVAEAHELAESGASELVLISQDTTSYGVDLNGKFQLAELLRRLSAVEGVRWIRLLYAYPAYLTDDMIDAIAELDRVVNYIDMPLQHISTKMLRHMGRRLMEDRTRRLLDRLRERIDSLYLRTTFIVGFPGENEHEFGILRDFISDFRFERLGVFPYSKEEDTPAAKFSDEVPEELIEERLEELMLLQQRIAFEQNRSRIGERCEVVLDTDVELQEEQVEDDSPTRSETPLVAARARSYGESPEIDPVIYVEAPGMAADTLTGAPKTLASGTAQAGFREIPTLDAGGRQAEILLAKLRTGQRLEVRITGSRDYDLLATPLPGSE